MVGSLLLSTKLVLTLGTVTPLPGNPQQVWIENKQVLKAETKAGRIFLRPQRPGFTLLQTNDKSYQISILNAADHLLLEKIKTPLGLEKSIDLGYPVVSGTLFRFQDLKSILDTSLKLQARLRLQLQLTSHFQEKYLNFIHLHMQSRGLKEFKLRWQDQRLSTKINSKTDLKSLTTYEAMGVWVEEADTQLVQEPTVKVSITVAEVKRSFTRKLGLKPPTSYSATMLSDGTLQKESGLEFNLQALEASGDAKILASPNIICRSGKEAEFFAGGEFPIKILNYKTQDVVWKKFGISLKVKPQADHLGQMNLSLETEVSNLDIATTVDGIPGITANRLSSHFDLKESRTIALSGLLKEDLGQSSEGWPWLQRIPILGNLFSSRDYRDSKTELIVFVRPEILSDDDGSLPASHLNSEKLRE